jgi:hypothetical protein
MEIKWKDKGVLSIQSAGAKAGKAGKEKLGSNKQNTS